MSTTSPDRPASGDDPAGVPDADVKSPASWAFCWRSLVAVSRTFSRPIGMLAGELRLATTCGYLLCRVADTIEDEPHLAYPERRRLFEQFLAVVEQDQSTDRFEEACELVGDDSAEWHLARNLREVMSVFRGDLSEASRAVCVDWIGEMVRGMDLYARRRPDPRGTITLHTIADLERYCYFVAGTVGRLMTALFVNALGPAIDRDARLSLHRHAESFGLGLQLVNILKDQTDDLRRGWSFIPSTVWHRLGKPRRQLAPPDYARAHRALHPIFERARGHLDRALEYVISLPRDARAIRLFCLLPLWMAARTLVLARGHDDLFAADKPVKISRDEVFRLIAQCTDLVDDDPRLRRSYQRLWT